MSDEELTRTTKLVVTRDGFKLLGDRVVDINYEYQLNPQTSPKLIDFRTGMTIRYGRHGVSPQRNQLGLYQLEGDILKICVASGAARPTELWAEFGSDKAMFIFQRIGKSAVEADEQTIQGDWEVVKASLGITELRNTFRPGEQIPLYAVPYGDILPGRQITIDRRNIIIKGKPSDSAEEAAGIPAAGGVVHSDPLTHQPLESDEPFSYALDSSRDPKTIELNDKVRVPCSGIYQLDGNRLTIRLGKDANRPTDIDAPADDGEVLLELKRIGDPIVEPPTKPSGPIAEEPTPETSSAATVKSDIEAVQGTWEVVSSRTLLSCFDASREGADLQAAVKTARVVITRDRLKVLGQHLDSRAFQYQIGSAAEKKMIELQVGKAVLLGIYKLEGDRLTICAGASERPTEFWAELGSSKDLLVLKRVGDAKVDPDDEALVGTWHAVSASGRVSNRSYKRTVPFLSGEVVDGSRMEMTKELLRFRSLRFPGQKYTRSTSGVYALDSSQTPKWIDFQLAEEFTLRGIYELQGDQLKICVGQQRPTQFEAEPVPDRLLFVLKRKPETTTVDVDADGTARLDGVKYDDTKSLADAMDALAEKKGDLRFDLLCDNKMSHKQVALLVDTLRDAGITGISSRFYSLPPPDGSRLEFRIAAVRATGETPGMSEEEIESLVEALTSGAPMPDEVGRTVGWFETEVDPQPEWITAEHEGRRYVLLSMKPEDTMLATDTGARQWAVTRVRIIEDSWSRPVIGVTLDAAGQKLIDRLHETHLGLPLAILVDDKVLVMYRLPSNMPSGVQHFVCISGYFSSRRVEALSKAIMVGKRESSEDTAAPGLQAAPQQRE